MREQLDRLISSTSPVDGIAITHESGKAKKGRIIRARKEGRHASSLTRRIGFFLEQTSSPAPAAQAVAVGATRVCEGGREEKE